MKAPASNVHPGVPATVSLRAARDQDTGLALTLYLQTMLPLLAALGLGDEHRLRARFRQGYRPECSTFVQVRGMDVGWMQVSAGPAGLHLDQLHLASGWRGRGIGSHLLGGLLAGAAEAGSTVALDVIRGNPAIGLYRRLGFRVVGEDEEKFQMLWRPPAPAGAA